MQETVKMRSRDHMGFSYHNYIFGSTWTVTPLQTSGSTSCGMSFVQLLFPFLLSFQWWQKLQPSHVLELPRAFEKPLGMGTGHAAMKKNFPPLLIYCFKPLTFSFVAFYGDVPGST